MTNKYANEIRNFIVNTFLFGEAGSLQEDTSFMESGTLDSTGVLELVTFLETTYGIKIPNEAMVPENLDSINRAAAFVARSIAPK